MQRMNQLTEGLSIDREYSHPNVKRSQLKKNFKTRKDWEPVIKEETQESMLAESQMNKQIQGESFRCINKC